MKTYVLRALGLATAALGISGGAALADSVTLTPGSEGKDAQITNFDSGHNYGGDPELIINWGNNARSIGLLQFDLSSVPSGVTVTSATLSLYQNTTPSTGTTYDVFRVTSAWNESTVTYNTAPTFNGTAVASMTADGTLGYKDWDVTSLVQGWLSGSFSNFGMWIEEVPVQGTGSAYFYSSDTSFPSSHPTLSIQYSAVPVPLPTAALGGAGLLAVVGASQLHRRRKRLI